MAIKARLFQAGATAAVIAAGSIAYQFEGERSRTYVDPVGVLTVCVGHTGPDVRLGQLYSEHQCTEMFIRDLRIAESAVERCTPGLPDGMKPALVSFVFNVGNNAFCQSTLVKLANAGDLCGACNQLALWVNATKPDGTKVVLPGLVRRREAERQACLDGALEAQ